MREGSDVSIIACGIMVSEAMKAAEFLKTKGIDAEVINMHTIKPIDKECIIDAAKKTGRIVTCEDHSIFGGLGSAVAEVLSSNYPANMRMIGVEKFAESGSTEELFKKYGLDSNSIANTARGLIR